MHKLFKSFLALLALVVSGMFINPSSAFAAMTLEDCQAKLTKAGIPAAEVPDNLDDCESKLKTCEACSGGKAAVRKSSGSSGGLARKVSVVERDVKVIKESLQQKGIIDPPAGQQLNAYVPPAAQKCEIRWKRNTWVSLGAGAVAGVVTSFFSKVEADGDFVNITSLPFKVGTAVSLGTFGGTTIYDANRCD